MALVVSLIIFSSYERPHFHVIVSRDKFALSVLMRPYKNTHAGLADVILRTDVLKLREELKGQQAEWVAFMKTMPPALLLVLRNQAYTRALCQELGNLVSRFRIMARSAAQGAHQSSRPTVVEDAPLSAPGQVPRSNMFL